MNRQQLMNAFEAAALADESAASVQGCLFQRKGMGADNGLLYARAEHVRNPIEGAISHCTCALVGKFGSVLARQYETRQARSVHVGKKRGGFAIECPFNTTSFAPSLSAFPSNSIATLS
jgi:hypothetical protein